jgi:Lrp/AsnC family transcriptional regulator for asnA, asnC and gidA
MRIRKLGTLKDVELRLISELMKNSRRSDRELSRVLKVSQPTVTRIRSRLEKEGYLKEFTTIPDFRKLGFELAAFILVRLKTDLTAEEIRKAERVSMKDMMEKAPDEIVLFYRGMGGGYDGVLVSFHKSYSDYSKLIERVKEYPFVDSSATLSFLVDLNDKVQYRPFTFSTLAKHLLTMQKQEKA